MACARCASWEPPLLTVLLACALRSELEAAAKEPDLSSEQRRGYQLKRFLMLGRAYQDPQDDNGGASGPTPAACVVHGPFGSGKVGGGGAAG